MKQRDLVKKLEKAGFEFARHGGNHDIYPLSARRLRPLRWEMNCVRYLLDIVF